MLAQRRVGNRGGEPAVPTDLPAGLDVRGALVSLDAASCRPGVAETITGRGADPLIALKGDSRALHAAVSMAVRAWFAAHAVSVSGGLWPCSDRGDDRHGRTVAPPPARGRREGAGGRGRARGRLAGPG